MSQLLYKTKKNTKLCDKTSGKCGEITFCLQLDTRVYALNCLFCPQICLQWDAFISHMEEVHDEELRLNHLLQQEIEEEVNLVEANISNQKTASKQSSVRLLEELPQSSQIRIRTEFNDGTSIEELLDYSEPLEEIETEKCESIRTTFKAEKYGSVPHKSFDSRMVKESTLDQSYESIEDQMDFCIQSPESNRDDKQSSKRDVPSLMEKLDEMKSLILRLLKEVKLIQNNKSQIYADIKKPSTLPQHPFENKEDFLNFEEHIHSSEEEFTNLVMELIENVSGNSKKFVKSCWRKLMRDDIAQDFCWQGTPVKPALKSMSTTLAIKQAYNQKFDDHSDAEFEKCTIYLFQQAKHRFTKKLFKTYTLKTE